MRRVSELPWVSGMSQIGFHGVGSARRQAVDDARAYGSVIVEARGVRTAGVERVLDHIPGADRYYIAFDADGLDPSIAPRVGAPAFDGLSYHEATDLLRGVAAKRQVVGFDFVELAPDLDVGGLTGRLAARLVLSMIGALAHAGRIGAPSWASTGRPVPSARQGRSAPPAGCGA